MSDRKSILIIEDDPDVVAVMKVTLEAEHFTVVSADDVDEGLTQAEKLKPDLVILDVMFGSQEKTKGFDCAIKMKQSKLLAPIPILMITAVNAKRPLFRFSPSTDGEYLPVDDFVDKPAKPKELVQKVNALLEQGTSKWVNWPEQPSR